MFDRIVCLDIIKGTLYFIFHANSLSSVTQGLEMKNKRIEILSQKCLLPFYKGKNICSFIHSTIFIGCQLCANAILGLRQARELQ